MGHLQCPVCTAGFLKFTTEKKGIKTNRIIYVFCIILTTKNNISRLVTMPANSFRLLLGVHFAIPAFSLEKKGIFISYQSRSVVRLSVCPSVRASVTFLVIESPPKL